VIRTVLPLALLVLAGCRGQASDESPVHLIGDMDWQPKVQPEEASPLFADGRGMRPLVPGTVPVGLLAEDDAYFRGKEGDKHVARTPVEVTETLLRRGQDRFNIYCTPCHDKTGSGRGTVIQRGYPPPIDLTGDRARGLPDGEIFDVITNGVRNMPAYRKQIPVEDRWAIVTWVRVLQRSQYGKADDVPQAERAGILPAEQGAEAAPAPAGKDTAAPAPATTTTPSASPTGGVTAAPAPTASPATGGTAAPTASPATPAPAPTNKGAQ